MGVVDHEQNNLRETVVMATCQIAEVVMRRVIAVHAEDTVCDDDRTPEGAGCVEELRLQLFEVQVAVDDLRPAGDSAARGQHSPATCR